LFEIKSHCKIAKKNYHSKTTYKLQSKLIKFLKISDG
jgi:hypothetical protein